ncbi:MAG: KH domain-containing protein [Candidatus Odinarchaeia archaeon]
MISEDYVKVPADRIGVIIGKKGEIKKKLEEATQTKIIVNSKDGTIIIQSPPDVKDPLAPLKAKYIILAMGRGFSPENAFKLLNDDIMLEIIDLNEYVRTKNSLTRIKGRIIGENGKTRKFIEEMTKTKISVYGHTVGIIGEHMHLEAAREAILMLIRGISHNTVYRFLSRKSREIKRRELELWEPYLKPRKEDTSNI